MTAVELQIAAAKARTRRQGRQIRRESYARQKATRRLLRDLAAALKATQAPADYAAPFADPATGMHPDTVEYTAAEWAEYRTLMDEIAADYAARCEGAGEPQAPLSYCP
jgi:hypothetical protein